MGLFDSFRGETIDIIEWLDDSRDTLVWRFPRHDNEIKMGAQLVVRESQAAVFINEGSLADTFGPGTYTLETQNLPVLSTLQGWKYGFESPFKAEVYFVNTRQFTDMKWGTQNPVMVRDPEFGPVRLRAFGGYSVRIVDPARFLQELAGTDPQFRTEEVSDYLRQMIVGRLGDALASAAGETPVLDLAANQHAIGERMAEVLSSDLAEVGVAVPRFIIENISLPSEVEEALDKRSQMGILGDLDQYAQFQAANAMEDAANNPGSGAGDAMGMGMGVAAGQQMASALGTNQQQAQSAPEAAQPQNQAGPPPLPQQEQWYLGVDGQQLGPFDASGMNSKAAEGVLGANTLVWKAGMDQWTPASQVPELAQLLSSTPPPLPPN
ncbi:SPFH domain-containing protein [Lipingzhangella sp. LS1_29]|uniref:SPFH domain-containing protein n=1 Tax=Lipingzhangella rawalii TaxID=2055835 RepID=A0ABU2H0H1_9ACTN|nr:SPFH domain-containing protein [Lipingzhangella rawalii]MDS1268799.1 SPFH domain-containing protein [Lipingzhangella rawalii]